MSADAERLIAEWKQAFKSGLWTHEWDAANALAAALAAATAENELLNEELRELRTCPGCGKSTGAGCLKPSCPMIAASSAPEDKEADDSN